MAIELQRSKEDRAAAKEWAQIDDLIKICDVAGSSSDWEAVALACLSAGHCLRRLEAGGPVGQGGEGIQFFGAKSRRGGQQQELGPWGREWLQFLVRLRALKGFHPDKGAWHGSGEALVKTLVRLLEHGGGGEMIRWHTFRRPGAAQLKHMGATMQTIML